MRARLLITDPPVVVVLVPVFVVNLGRVKYVCRLLTSHGVPGVKLVRGRETRFLSRNQTAGARSNTVCSASSAYCCVLTSRDTSPGEFCLGFVSPPFSSLPRREADHFCQCRGLGLGAFRALYH